MPRRMTRISAITVLPAAVTLFAACAGEVNHSNALGGGTELETFADRTPAMPPPGPQGDGPSITSLDRANWPERAVLVPAGNVEHYPTYTSGLEPRYARDLPRQRGEFPTQDSALDTWTSRSGLALSTEAFAAPFWAGFDTLAAPVRFFLTPPWAVTNSPGVRQRSPGVVQGSPAAPTSAPRTVGTPGTMELVR